MLFRSFASGTSCFAAHCTLSTQLISDPFHAYRNTERGSREARVDVVDLTRAQTDLLALVAVEHVRLGDLDAVVHLGDRGDELVLVELRLLPTLLTLRLELLLEVVRGGEALLEV